MRGISAGYRCRLSVWVVSVRGVCAERSVGVCAGRMCVCRCGVSVRGVVGAGCKCGVSLQDVGVSLGAGHCCGAYVWGVGVGAGVCAGCRGLA